MASVRSRRRVNHPDRTNCTVTISFPYAAKEVSGYRIYFKNFEDIELVLHRTYIFHKSTSTIKVKVNYWTITDAVTGAALLHGDYKESRDKLIARAQQKLDDVGRTAFTESQFEFVFNQSKYL